MKNLQLFQDRNIRFMRAGDWVQFKFANFDSPINLIHKRYHLSLMQT